MIHAPVKNVATQIYSRYCFLEADDGRQGQNVCRFWDPHEVEMNQKPIKMALF